MSTDRRPRTRLQPRLSAGREHGPSEEESHREHRAALEATLFHDPTRGDEVVLELDSGLLRLLTPER